MMALVVIAMTSAAALDETVLIVPNQGIGRDPAFIEKLGHALRQRVAEKRWALADVEQTAKNQRAATMCGEDSECLATIGRKQGTRWVLAFGAGRVGTSVLVTAVLIDASLGMQRNQSRETLTTRETDTEALSQRLTAVLFDGLSAPAALAPHPAAVPVVEIPAAPVLQVRPSLRPWALGTAVAAGALGLAGGTLTVVAQQHFTHLPEVAPTQRPDAVATQRSLNLSADLVVGTAIAAAVVAVVLFVIDAHTAPEVRAQ